MEPAPIKIRILIVDDQLVVREGLRMLIENHPGTKVVAMASTRSEALEILALFGERLVPRINNPAFSLSYANRRRLEIARALALKPRVLFLDEPTAGMNPTETAEMLEIIRTLKGRFTILLIEHKLDLVMQLSDRVAVMDDGAKIAEGSARDVASDPAVIAAYLGSREVGRARAPAEVAP